MSNYTSLSNNERIDVLKTEYTLNKKSIRRIAEELGVGSTTIKRDLGRFGIPIRDKSEAQSNALATGVHKHPTKGTERDAETKAKISDKQFEVWKNADKQERSEIGKKVWDNLGIVKQQEIRKKGHKALREATLHGSKLEKHLQVVLAENGYGIIFHQERSLGDTRLQVDLMIPSLGVAIEVNGVSHQENVWGDKSFARTKSADHTKKNLLLQYGYTYIIVWSGSNLSQKRKRMLTERLLDALTKVKSGTLGTKFLEIDDKE
jgi:very-short-patch-repair endonuclease